MRYRFEDSELDTSTFELRVGGAGVRVEPQVFEVLAYLVENRDRLVPRTELLDEVWGDRFVSDSALASRIAAARAAIGDDGRAQRCIRTVHGRGVQFVAAVEEAWPTSAAPLRGPRPDDLEQTVRFVETADGTHLAVASVGDGVPLVKAANWLTHVDREWQSPVWRHWIEELGARFRYIRYDGRGCGLSDRDLSGSDLTDPGLWTSDLEAVVDSADIERFVLLGVSQGTIPAISYAVRHPERVAHLVIYGGYARGMARRSPEEAAVADTMLDMIRIGWGGTNPMFRTTFTLTFLPDGTSEQIRWFTELQADTTTPENAVRLEGAFHHLDITELASRVAVPTTVIHCDDDRATPYAEGRRLAGAIPDARFITLDSANHILTADEPAWPEFLRHLDGLADELAPGREQPAT